MEMQYFKEYSPALGREMECKVYGHGGRPMLYHTPVYEPSRHCGSAPKCRTS